VVVAETSASKNAPTALAEKPRANMIVAIRVGTFIARFLCSAVLRMLGRADGAVSIERWAYPATGVSVVREYMPSPTRLKN